MIVAESSYAAASRRKQNNLFHLQSIDTISHLLFTIQMKMKLISILLSLLALALLPSGSRALKTTEMPDLTDESVDTAALQEEALKVMGLAQKFTELVPAFQGDDALGLAQLIQSVKEDEETKKLLKEYANLGSDIGLEENVKNAGEKDIAGGLIQIYEELKAMDILFQDPQRAVEEVNKEGMIEDDEKLKLYREDPTQLEADMREGLYLSFVYVASAGGYL